MTQPVQKCIVFYVIFQNGRCFRAAQWLGSATSTQRASFSTLLWDALGCCCLYWTVKAESLESPCLGPQKGTRVVTDTANVPRTRSIPLTEIYLRWLARSLPGRLRNVVAANTPTLMKKEWVDAGSSQHSATQQLITKTIKLSGPCEQCRPMHPCWPPLSLRLAFWSTRDDSYKKPCLPDTYHLGRWMCCRMFNFGRCSGMRSFCMWKRLWRNLHSARGEWGAQFFSAYTVTCSKCLLNSTRKRRRMLWSKQMIQYVYEPGSSPSLPSLALATLVREINLCGV